MPPAINQITHETRDQLRQIAQRLHAAQHGEQKAIVADAAALQGCSVATLYRRLQTYAGWASGRKVRADKGYTAQGQEAIEMVGALEKNATRQNGKITMHTPTAISIAAANGYQIMVSADRFQRILKAQHLDAATQRRAAPHTQLRSLHPNHVHQVDPSLCVVYYLRGKQHIIQDKDFYKNKLDRLSKVDFKCWRYTLVDHTTGYVLVRYYAARAELTINLFDFLIWCWTRQPGRPFCGAPEMLIWDKGSANTSAAIKNVLTALKVRAEEHMAGNPRAKGSVESGNNLVETHFECRLRAEPVADVEALNAAAQIWSNAYNANLIPHVDCALHRNGVRIGARADLWLTIRQEQLRIPPALDICSRLLEGKIETRKVRGDLTVSYKHPTAERSSLYDLRHIDGVVVGDELEISPLLLGDCAVIVRVPSAHGVVEHELAPVVGFDAFGFRQDAPTIGVDYRSAPDTAVETAGKKLDRIAHGANGRSVDEITKAKAKGERPFEGRIDAHSHLAAIQLPAYMQRRGEAIDTPRQAALVTKPLSHVEAAMALKHLLGEAWTSAMYQSLETLFPDGVPEAEIEALAARFRSAGADPTQFANASPRPFLRAVA